MFYKLALEKKLLKTFSMCIPTTDAHFTFYPSSSSSIQHVIPMGIIRILWCDKDFKLVFFFLTWIIIITKRYDGLTGS